MLNKPSKPAQSSGLARARLQPKVGERKGVRAACDLLKQKYIFEPFKIIRHKLFLFSEFGKRHELFFKLRETASNVKLSKNSNP